MGENIQKHTSDKGLTFRIYQEILQLNHNQNNSIQMLAKDLNRHFSKDTIQMAGLTGEARLIGHLSTKQKAASSVPSQGTCLGCGLVPS